MITMHSSHRLGSLVASGLLLFAPTVLAQDPAPAPNPEPVKQEQTVDVWEDPARLAQGQEMLTALYTQAGGLDKWAELGALRFDLLETWRVLTNRTTGEIKVHHYTPRYCWFQTGGDGFVRSEYFKSGPFEPIYRREVAVGNYAWAEADSEFDRKPKAAAKARTRVNRLHFLTTMPFSIGERGGELVFLKDLDEKRALYGLHLARPLVMGITEEISDFLLVVDKANKRILQLQYSLTGADRETVDRSTECYVDFEGSLEVAGVTLAHKHVWFFELDLRREEYLVEDLEAAPIPPEALRRPWQAGAVWKTDLRADYWDPPAKQETTPGS